MEIKTRKELKEVIEADKSRCTDFAGKRMWIEYLKGNLYSYAIYKYIKKLRRIEYLASKRNSLIGNICFLLAKHDFKRYQLKTQIFIQPNVFDKGLCIRHPGYIWIDQSSQIGKNCTVLPRVLAGKRVPGLEPPIIFIGDNCYIGTGVTILGPVKIGDNVTIAAGSVVTHDIPNNCIAAGVTAKIVKTNVGPMRP